MARIGSQRRDNRSSPHRLTRRTDWDLDRVPAPPVGPRVLLAGCRPWGGDLVVEALAAGVPCPICRGRDLPWTWYCLWCDRCGQDGHVEYPGDPVGSRIREDWRDECPTRYAPPRDGLAGGRGRASGDGPRAKKPPAQR